MAERLTRQLAAEKAIIHEAPVLRLPTTVDRNFELPTGLYMAKAGLFFAFIAITSIGFASPEMILPAAICVIFTTLYFAVPAMWVRMKPEHPQRATSWARFQREGIMTPYGRATAGAATVQVLILPVLILLWGIAVVTIAALAR
jgi:hypothetical protein